ncbi:uncharacterized protein LOC110441212, partial [Mizuhopecten yessoensis]|uniref:uncharacterized protein LOC110441212 n=1 Tax=Mizuhopecten yessoensis TaxID=6573 RepID=UPI000B45ACEC
IPDAALLRILPRFTLQFNDDGQWRPSQIDGVLRKITDDTLINFVLPVGNVAHAQAWSHIFGYYIPVMPVLERRIKSFELFTPNNMPVCVYELIPKTCDIPEVLGQTDPSIVLAGKLEKIVVNRAGNKNRTYIPNVYRIQEGQRVYYCVAQYPNVLSAIDKMEKSKEIRMDKKDKKIQVKRFANTLRTFINHSDNTLCRNKIRVLQFDDEKEKPRDVLLRAIKEDLVAPADVSGIRAVSNKTNSKCECDAYIVCSDCDTEEANRMLDFLKEKRKIVDCCESRCGPQFQSLQKDIENSRWVILLLSKEALTDPRMDYNIIAILNDGVKRHDLNILPVLIDLEEKHIPDALRWIGFLEKKHGYEERLLQWIEGNDVPFALDSTCLPAWNIGYTLALGYIVNYLHTVLNQFCDFIPRALGIKNIDHNTCPQKVYLIVPDSGICTDLVHYKCEYVEHAVRFAEIDDFQGAANIIKSLDVYKITDPATKESYYMVCQFPAPILTLCKMNDSKIAGLNDQTMREEADRFCTTLSLLMHGPVGNGLADKYELVRYDDSTQEGLPNKIIPLIKRDIGFIQRGST